MAAAGRNGALPRRRHRALATLAVAALAAGLTACGSAAGKPAPPGAVRLPTTPAGRQASWLLGALEHLPVPASAIDAHFDRAFLALVPAPAAAALNASFAGLHGLRLDSVATSTPTTLVLVVTAHRTRLDATIAVDARGLISRLHTRPVGAPSPVVPAPVAAGGPTVTTPSGIREIPVGVGSPPLRGTLTLPAGKGPFPAVVLVSGSGPSDQDETVGPNRPFLDIALGLAARGVATIRYDKRTRDYPREIDRVTFTPTKEYVPDALAAIRLLEHRAAIDPRRIFVLGHSQGGTYAPLIAKRAPRVAGVILLAAGAETTAHALERQTHYLATLPGAVGAQARASLPLLAAEIARIDDPAQLAKESPSTMLLGGTAPAYYLDEYRYHEVAVARAIPQPLLLLQGDRDYQVTVKDDLDVWLRGLRGRPGVTVERFPRADHLFLDGTGPPTPLDYTRPGHVDPAVIRAIADWIAKRP